MKKIPLTQGKHALVDDEDFELVSAFKWQAWKNKAVWYARRGRRTPNKKTIFMHRLIMHAKSTEMIDHLNGDGLDNQRGNLRFCTYSEQNLNRRTSSKYGFRGVAFHADCKKPWRARVKVNGKEIGLGSYETAEEAARGFDLLAPKYIGVLYRPNFPRGSGLKKVEERG